MAREIGELSAARVAKERTPGVYSDGGGLYLNINPNGARSWLFRYSSPTIKQAGLTAGGKPRNPNHGRPREMGLGAVQTVSLAESRELAREARNLVRRGIDPIEHRDAALAAQAAGAAHAMPFDECAEAYMAAHRGAWKNSKDRAEWKSALAPYERRISGPLPPPPAACADGLKLFSIGQRRAATAPAKTPRGGRATSKTFFRRAAKSQR